MKRPNSAQSNPLDTLPSTATTDAAVSDTEEEIPVSPSKKKDKGKSRMKELPELPESIWTRIFELYYEDVAEGESTP